MQRVTWLSGRSKGHSFSSYQLSTTPGICHTRWLWTPGQPSPGFGSSSPITQGSREETSLGDASNPRASGGGENPPRTKPLLQHQGLFSCCKDWQTYLEIHSHTDQKCCNWGLGLFFFHKRRNAAPERAVQPHHPHQRRNPRRNEITRCDEMLSALHSLPTHPTQQHSVLACQPLLGTQVPSSSTVHLTSILCPSPGGTTPCSGAEPAAAQPNNACFTSFAQ